MSAQSEIRSPLEMVREAHFQANGDAPPNLEQLRSVIDTMVPFCNLTGVRVVELRRDGGVAELPNRPDLQNHMGTVHAAAQFLAAEVSGAAAFSGALAPRIFSLRSFVLRDCRIMYLRPAVGRIRAHGSVDIEVAHPAAERTAEERFEIRGGSLLYDDAGALVAKAEFDYRAWFDAS
ncbi:uncharacterized protein, possibly involved in aromatic compounds catabolism [Frankia casuarinae]|nr:MULTISPECIES: PaaI family thioesterase [Frankia]ETA01121.1 uncharacterized protein, possibly involved in aromatic compounds catabolism [Frankia sp. CcI6]EYT90043.1 uncharacterized protein, possibly involved in aromatic compounds catabolism [Frankia casuarinae]KDA42167.1 uncharacterized protein, possibly involved in aromatic compounds catabolism [Frankia sp. BMG5.23]KEZ35717.1 uncharacterized protein, possibly involved in aromatic compounds catabolism [Frankia sp. CeD]KFB03171.1 uncharacteri